MLPAGIYRSIHCVREMLSLVSACVPPRPQLILSFSVHSGGSTVAIDNKIEQAMVSTVVPVVWFCFTCLFLLLCESLDGILFVRTESLKWKSPDLVSLVSVFLCDIFPVKFSCRVLLASTRFYHGLFGTTQHLTPGRVCYCWAPSRPQGGHIGTTVESFSRDKSVERAVRCG